MSVKQTAPSGDSAMARHAASMVFPIGAPNDGFAQYFTGRGFLAPVSAEQVGIFNVTFEPGCRNNWHIHHAKSGGGQILICVAGRGFYQEWGRAAVRRAGGARRVRRKNTSQSASLLSQRGPALLGQKIRSVSGPDFLCRMFRVSVYAFLAMSHRAVKATASLMAISESILRLIWIPATFRPCIKVE